MFDRLVEIFCDFDDFCKAVKMEWEAMLVTEENKPRRQSRHGPECGLCDSEIMTLLVLDHASRFNNVKTFDNGVGDCPKIWGIMTIGIRPVGYVAGWGSADGMDAAFGWDGD